jgi:hypothetical protein
MAKSASVPRRRQQHWKSSALPSRAHSACRKPTAARKIVALLGRSVLAELANPWAMFAAGPRIVVPGLAPPAPPANVFAARRVLGAPPTMIVVREPVPAIVVPIVRASPAAITVAAVPAAVVRAARFAIPAANVFATPVVRAKIAGNSMVAVRLARPANAKPDILAAPANALTRIAGDAVTVAISASDMWRRLIRAAIPFCAMFAATVRITPLVIIAVRAYTAQGRTARIVARVYPVLVAILVYFAANSRRRSRIRDLP